MRTANRLHRVHRTLLGSIAMMLVVLPSALGDLDCHRPHRAFRHSAANFPLTHCGGDVAKAAATAAQGRESEGRSPVGRLSAVSRIRSVLRGKRDERASERASERDLTDDRKVFIQVYLRTHSNV